MSRRLDLRLISEIVFVQVRVVCMYVYGGGVSDGALLELLTPGAIPCTWQRKS
jgi:hypothetical protein